jgi:large subunit ribosomal protein L30
MLKITLTSGKIGKKETQVKVLKALGLGKYGSEVVHADTPTIRGMINKVSHLVCVNEVPKGTATGKITRRARRESCEKAKQKAGA